MEQVKTNVMKYYDVKATLKEFVIRIIFIAFCVGLVCYYHKGQIRKAYKDGMMKSCDMIYADSLNHHRVRFPSMWDREHQAKIYAP
jgi:hypothetical protein